MNLRGGQPAFGDSETSQSSFTQKVTSRATLKPSIVNATIAEQKVKIARKAREVYGQDAKDLQIEAVVSLIAQKNTFALVGTGFGKSRIAELYYRMFFKSVKAIVLTLNPLDSLGDNQVKEKEAMGLKAVNLTKLSFTGEVASKIAAGYYSFIYLSPEIFLTSDRWSQLYFSTSFQNRLVLKVVDEAHVIYSWGLVESGKAKRLACHKQTQDRAFFRPSYGNLGVRLMATNRVPVILLSATCRPIAIEQIQKSLKIVDGNMNLIQGELTRPEIRLIRVPMTQSLISAMDLHPLFPRRDSIEDSMIPPTLIYSGTQNSTYKTLEVINRARGRPQDSFDGQSCLAQRYHASTGPLDKERRIDDFAAGKFPVICCTMALGLGQNWTRVRRVIQMGRADPPCVAQVVGRCGRDGRPGLGIMIFETKRRNGRNKLTDFDDVVVMNDDDRMDALAITKVCLRTAFSIDNLKGYIPLALNDLNYIEEREREVSIGMPTCNCSNCDPSGAVDLIRTMKEQTIENFDSFIIHQGPPQTNPAAEFPKVQKNTLTSKKVLPLACMAKDTIRSQAAMVNLVEQLTRSFVKFHRQLFKGMSMDLIFGSEPIVGVYDELLACIQNWKQGDVGRFHTDWLADEQIQKDQKELDQIQKKMDSDQKKKMNQVKKLNAQSNKNQAACLREVKRNNKRKREDDASAKKIEDAAMLAIYKQESLDCQQALK